MENGLFPEGFHMNEEIISNNLKIDISAESIINIIRSIIWIFRYSLKIVSQDSYYNFFDKSL